MNATDQTAELIRAGGPQVPALLERIERRLRDEARGHGALLALHAGATIEAGGKRLRPLLVLLAAGDPQDEASADALERCGAAVELVHSATLVHDDVLDGASLRRGEPTVVARGGRLIATSTGDLLFARAFGAITGATGLAQPVRAQALRALSDACSALARGELLQRADAWDGSISLERYLLRCELKTARLFEAACRLGTLAAGDPEADLGGFGRQIGLAFQILDDVLDVSGPAERTGKHRGTDLLDGTVTLPLILARERDQQLAGLDLRALEGAVAAERVCDRIAATGALDEARERALELVAGAKAQLPASLGEQRIAALALVADSVVARYR